METLTRLFIFFFLIYYSVVYKDIINTLKIKKGEEYEKIIVLCLTFTVSQVKADGWSSFLQTYNGSGSRYSNYITYNF